MKTILIANHYNLNNGDRAVFESTLQLLCKYFPDYKIIVSAYDPDKIHDERCVVVGWPLKNNRMGKVILRLCRIKAFRKILSHKYMLFFDKKYVEAVRFADIVLISGGHHLTDILGLNSFYSLANNFIAPIDMRKKIILLPQSIGPAIKPDIQKVISYVLGKACLIAYRDNASNEFLKQIACQTPIQYVPDLVYNLRPRIKENNRECDTVGVALYHAYSADRKEEMLSFTINNLIDVINTLLEKGKKVRILPMDIGDELVAKQIYDSLQSKQKKELFEVGQRSKDILDLINEFGKCHCVLAYKTHATVFSMISYTPLIAIAYHPKSIEFMESAGLSEYAILDNAASSEILLELVEKLEMNYEYIREKEICAVASNRILIKEYIERILKDEIG